MPYGWSDKEMIHALSDMTDAYLDEFTEFSKKSNLIIIAGSHPVRRSDGFIYNVAHIFSPSGNVYTQDKLHITPKETRLWDLKPGNRFVFSIRSLAGSAFKFVMILNSRKYPG